MDDRDGGNFPIVDIPETPEEAVEALPPVVQLGPERSAEPTYTSTEEVKMGGPTVPPTNGVFNVPKEELARSNDALAKEQAASEKKSKKDDDAAAKSGAADKAAVTKSDADAKADANAKKAAVAAADDKGKAAAAATPPTP